MIESTLPILYGRTSKGIVKQWRIIISADEETSGVAFVRTQYGQIKGKKTDSVARKVYGKNIGRSNQTTPWQQAQFQAESKWKQQLDSNYRETIAELDHLPDLPMLALKYKDRSHNIKWPAFAQPKLNGVRCFAKKMNGKIEYTTRKGKKWETLSYMDEHLLPIMNEGETFDGEIFNPNLTFQEITSRAKRVLADRSDIEKDPVQFHIFDIVDKERVFSLRTDTVRNRLKGLKNYRGVNQAANPLVAVPTVFVGNENEFFDWHTKWTAEGYEGSMVRNINGLYVPDYRSKDLQKHKDFLDEEFEIVGGKEGEGKDEGTIIFKCITHDGKEFDPRPKGSWELRHKYWIDLPNLIGKMLTVRYQNLSDDGIPIFPVGLSVRDYE